VKIKLLNAKGQLKSYEKKELELMSKNLDSLRKNISFNDKRVILDKHIFEIAVEYENGFYTVAVFFRVEPFVEYYVIDRNYNYAVSVMEEELVIPLNEKAQDKLDKDNSGELAEQLGNYQYKVTALDAKPSLDIMRPYFE